MSLEQRQEDRELDRVVSIATRPASGDDARVELDRVIVLFRALHQEGVEYVLVGGTAMNLHGVVRATEDVGVFLKVDPANVDRLRNALRRVWDDPDIEQITFADLAGEYPVVRYGPPGEDFVVDIMSRLGEAISFEDLESETIDIEDTTVQIATPASLFMMKKDTVRPIDRADADALRHLFDLEDDR